jgi:glycosyltransferase involved in cell wall biosynthesis
LIQPELRLEYRPMTGDPLIMLKAPVSAESPKEQPRALNDVAPMTVVLMSTYNGERYVVEQLNSILAQLPSGGKILVRDDGSTDGTVQKVSELTDPRIELVVGTNLGFGASFLTLLQLAPAETEMVMFSDQDDVWLPGKISRAWDHLKALAHVPALYGSAQTLVDQNLDALGVTPSWQRNPSFSGALTENIITGCTAALNQRALALLKYAGVPSQVYFHDWWCYLVVSAFGTVIHDNESRILYRQHSNNQIGHGAGWLGRQLGILRFLNRNDWVGIMLGQIFALLVVFKDKLPSDRSLLIHRYFEVGTKCANARWSFLLGFRLWRQTLVKEFLFRVLLGLYKLRLWPPARLRKNTTGVP